jgi:hypothetical protein
MMREFSVRFSSALLGVKGNCICVASFGFMFSLLSAGGSYGSELSGTWSSKDSAFRGFLAEAVKM